MILNSNTLTFVDTTDTKRIDVHISSNKPTTQIYDINNMTYTPSWVPTDSNEPLQLDAVVYADSLEVTDLSTIKWYKNSTNNPAIDTEISSQLIIDVNALTAEESIVEYICTATYNNVPYENKITFTLITTGKNGLDGQDGKNGQDGKDGTSVNIIGTAYAKTTPVTGSTIDLYSDVNTSNRITSGTKGDAYLVDGYLCVYNVQGNNFICTGKIQGAKGEKGDSSYLFVRYADDQYGTNMSSSSDGKTYIGFYRNSVDEAPTDASLITWTKFVGTSASLVTITPSALYFKSTEGKNGIFTPEYIYLYPRFQTVTYSNWQYSVDGGVTWSNATGANGLTISTYNSVANSLRISRTSTLYTDTITSISFRCLSSNNAIYDTVSVAKIYDVVDLKIGGRNLARYTDSENWISYLTSAVSFSEGSRSKRIRAVCSATDTANTAVFGIQQSASSRLMKLKSGQEYTLSFLVRGNVSNVRYSYLMNPGSTNQFIENIDSSSISETEFTRIVQTFTANQYVDTSTGSYLMISSVGPKDPSKWFEVEEVQLEAGQVATDWSPSPEDILDSAANINVMLSNEAHFFEADSKGIPTATSIVLDVFGFKGSVQSLTTVGTIGGLPSAGMTATISNNGTTNTTITIAVTTALTSTIADYGTLTIPITVNGRTINKVFSWSKAKAGVIGATGIGIKSTTVTYGVSDSASTKPSDFSWQTDIPTVADGKYLWTRTIVDYTDSAMSDTITYTYTKQGTKGDTGSIGSSVTVESIQYQEGMSATTAPTGNWSTSVVEADEGKYLWTKTTFSDGKVAYGVAKQGSKGDKGDTGIPASLVDITPSALYFKSTTGKNGTFDPEYIYLYPRFQNVTYAGWQYSTDGGSTWNNIASANGLLVVSHNSISNTLRISRASTLYTDTITSISFKCLTSNTSVYDTVSVAKIYDVVDLEIGGRNYIPNSDTVWSTPGIASNSAYGIYKNGLNSVYEQLVGKQLMISFEVLIETTDGNNGRIQVYGTNGNPKYRLSTVRFENIVPNQWQKLDTSINIIHIEDNTGEGRIEFYGIDPNVSKIHIRKFKLEVGNKVTDWTPAPEDLIESSSNVSVILSNEAHIFEADVNGVALPSTIVLDVMGFKGATRTSTTIGSITGIPSTGMSVSTSDNNTTNTKITIGVTKNLTSAISDYGTLTIPITVNGHTVNKVFSWAKSNDMTNLQIGGRNLLKWTKNLPITTTRNSPDGISTYSTANLLTQTDDGIKLTFNGTQSAALSVPLVYDGCIKNNEVITLSFDYRGNITDVGTFYFLQRTSPNVSLALSPLVTLVANETEWQHCEATFSLANANERVNYQMLLFYNLAKYTSENWIEIKNESLKLETGHKATSWTPAIEDTAGVTFQLYAPKGYLITKDTPEVTLETFTYDGNQPITNATFQWYNLVNDVWTVIADASENTLSLNKNSVLKSNVYKCEMTYKGNVYEDTATVEDKTDIYESVMCISSNARGSDCYWVLYTLVYTDAEEIDSLLGPIAISAPSSPVSGDYWYAIDATNASVQLKKYNGTSWENSTDTQSLSYYWDIVNNGSEKVPFGDHSKVQVVSCHDFTSTATLVCGVNSTEDGLLTQSSLSLTDASDPIVSDTQPTATVHGQIWIKPNDNGTYLMFIWDESSSSWISSDMDARSKVYTNRPSSYNAGDLWITASDTDHSSYLQGTLLQAQANNTIYNEADWSPTLKYDKDLDGMKETLNNLSQYVTITSSGLRVAARDSAGNLSEFTSLFTSEALTFYQGSKELLILANNQLTAPKIVVEDELEVQGEIKLGDLKLIIESNGSFSFAVEK